MGAVTEFLTLQGVQAHSSFTDILASNRAPNIAPVAPGEIGDEIALLLGWLKWGALIAGVIGLIISGIMMIMGRRGRNQTAIEGAVGIPWVLAGLTLVALSTFLVNAVFFDA